MDNGNRKNINSSGKKTGARRPSKAVSSPNNKFIQYPVANSSTTPHQQPKGKKSLKANPVPDTHRKSRKTIRKQKARRLVTPTVLVAILLAICVFISLKVLFIVRHVEVVGSERYTQEEITNYCAIPLEENIFKIDTETLSRALPQDFTYVETANVQRKLPDKILITITDSVPTYYGETVEGDLSTYTIYSQNFKKLTAQATLPEGLVGISADLTDETAMETLQTMIDKLAQSGYTGVTKITIGAENDISITYDGRVEVQLGTMLDMDYKLKMSYHILLNELTETDAGIIDSTQAGSSIFKPSKLG